jgi:hypothetical protein
MFFKKGLSDSSLIHKLAKKNPRMSKEMLDITNKYALVEEARPSTPESRRRSQATGTSLAHPRATTRRGKQIILSTRWNDCDATRSTGPGRVNLKASWIASAFFTLKESIRPGVAIDSKVL